VRRSSWSMRVALSGVRCGNRPWPTFGDRHSIDDRDRGARWARIGASGGCGSGASPGNGSVHPSSCT
jgi:hypothetical protein